MTITSTPPTHKDCASCKQHLELTKFTNAPRMALGKSSYCNACSAAKARERHVKNGAHMNAVANAARKRRYTTEWRRLQTLKAHGLTPETYQALFESQSGRCAICKTDTPGGRGDWHIDHCHTTDNVRGLLCATCNVGIGMFRDDPEHLQAAINYLKDRP